MKRIIPPLIIGLFLACLPGSAKPTATFRLLKTDPKTAGFIRKAIDEGLINAAEMEDRLDQLDRGGKVSEVARFTQAFSPDGEKIAFEKDVTEIKIADGELMKVGIFLEVEPHASHLGLVDLRFDLNHSVSIRKNRIDSDRTLVGLTVKANTWQILTDWGDASEATLLMAKFSGIETKANPARLDSSLREIHCRSELLLCDADDLKKFNRSTPATRAKAIDWLKGRGAMVATSGLQFRSGQKVVQQDVLEWIHDDNGWDTAELGLTLEVEGTIGPFGKLLDLRLNASWHPRDANRPPDEPQFAFVLADAAVSGSTLVIEAKARPDEGPVPVLFVTPRTLTIHEGAEPRVSSPQSKLTQTGSRTYLVHPAMMRKLAEAAKFNPAPAAGVVRMPMLKELLEELGMSFPESTRVMFDSSRCRVILFHNPEGHARFEAILAKHELAITSDPADGR